MNFPMVSEMTRLSKSALFGMSRYASPLCHVVHAGPCITLCQEFFPCRFNDRKNRQIPHRLEKRDYVQVRNESAADGLWKINNARRVVYAKKTLPLRDRMEAVKDLADR
jgi:hypothetical protein